MTAFALDPQLAEALAPTAEAMKDITAHLRPGVPHEFDAAAPDADVARRALEDRLRVLAGL